MDGIVHFFEAQSLILENTRHFTLGGLRVGPGRVSEIVFDALLGHATTTGNLFLGQTTLVNGNIRTKVRLSSRIKGKSLIIPDFKLMRLLVGRSISYGKGIGTDRSF